MKNPLLLLFVFATLVAGCTDQSPRMEEPVMSDPKEMESVDEDLGGGAESDAAEEPAFDAAPSPDMDDAAEGNSADEEAGDQDEAVTAPPAESAPSDKGGIISSGVKPKPTQRCNLIEDDLERRRCLMKQSKKKRGS